jgi:hypothetical protein
MKPDLEEIGFVHGQSIFEWSHSSKSPHDYSLCRAARRRSSYFIAAGKNHVKHEEGLCVLFGVRHEALERGGSTTRCMQLSKKNGLGALSDIIDESRVTGNDYF